MPYTEKQLVAALRRLEKNWPEGFTLFDRSGSLCLLRDKLIRQGRERFEVSDAIVEEFLGISSGGGDPD